MKQFFKKAMSMMICTVLCIPLCCLCTSAVVIDVAAGKGGGGSNYEDGYDAGKLTDGNESYTSMAWIYGQGGHVYIDLESAYNIEAIEILAYNGVDRNRSGNFDIYLTNEEPTISTTNKVKIATHEAPESESSTPIPYVRYNIDPAVKETAYRYVSLEKFSDSTGLIVQEVKVYANYQTQPTDVLEIASGKPNGWGVDAGGELDYPPTGNILTDGDLTIYAGDINPYEGEYIYVDLEGGQKLSKLELIAYDANGGAGVDIYLTNTNPANGFDPMTAELVGEAPVCYASSASDAEAKTTHIMSSTIQAQSYQYIVLKRKSGTSRFRVQELKAYAVAGDLQMVLSEADVAFVSDALIVSGKLTNGPVSDAVVLFSTYNSEGAFLNAQAQSLTLPSYSISEPYHTSIDISAVIAAGPARVDMIILDNLTDRNILFMAENVTDGAVVSNLLRTDGTFTYNSGQNKRDILLSGMAPGNVVLAMILEADASFNTLTAGDVATKVLYCGTAKTGSDGSYSLTAQLPPEVISGNYPLGYGLSGTTTSQKSTSLPYVDFNENVIISTFKLADATSFAAAVTTYQDMFEGTLLSDITAAGASLGSYFVLARDCMKNYECNDTVSEIVKLEDIDTVIKAAILMQATATQTDFDAKVTAYKDSMPLIFGQYYDAAEFETVFNKVKTAEAPTTAAEFYNAYQKSMGLCAILNGSNSDKIYALNNYASYLGIDSTDIGNSSVAEIVKQLGNTEQDITSYVGGMGSAVRAAAEQTKTEETGTKNVTNTGNGVKRSGGMSIPRVEADVTPVQPDNVGSQIEFNDLANYDWAKPSIDRLMEQKILKGKSETEFAPADSLTRGEAAKLIVLVFGLTTTGTAEEVAYSDCDIAAWYYPFVEAASANSVMIGVDRNSFGVANNITKQDMAVIISRGLTKAGIWKSGDAELSFIDADSISPYAISGVGLLAELGIIKGADDGAFYPHEHITRAEAAVMMDRTLSLLSEQTN